MIDHLPAMIEAGISALKIEGRMKGIHYTATTVNAYRSVLDHYYAAPDRFAVEDHWRKELEKVTSRGYCTGFYLGDAIQAGVNTSAPRPPATALAAKVLASAGPRMALVDVRNQIHTGDDVEVLSPGRPPRRDKIVGIINSQQELVPVANPGGQVRLQLNNNCRRLDLLRRTLQQAVTRR
jgi:putative protease